MRDIDGNSDVSRLLLEHMPAAVAMFDSDMRYLGCSRRWLKDYGIAAEDIIGRSHYDIFPEIDQRWRDIHRRALTGETVSSEVEPFARADGTTDWVKWEMVPWYRAPSEIGGALVFSEVLNDLVRSRQQARALTTEFGLLVDSASDYAIFLLDVEGKVAIWNKGAERMHGWREGEAVGQPYSIVFEAGDRAAGLPQVHLDEARRDGRFHGRSWRMCKDGSRFLADVTISRIVDENGDVIAFGKVVRDVTEETTRASENEVAEALLRSILDTVPEAMITIDEMGVILSFSTAAQHLFGYAPEEVLGHNVAMLMPDPDAARHDGYLAQYRATGERHVIGTGRRVLGRRKDGTTFQLKLNVGEARGGGTRVFAGFVRDLTAEEEAETKLRELQSELLHMSRVSAVGTMATALAHELNQPLTANANYVQTAAAILAGQEDQTLAVVREALEEAGREALRAGGIIHRLRDFVARGELERGAISPRELATQACALGAVGTRSRGIRCEVLIAQSMPQVMVDRVQVQQVIINLIRNAVEAVGDSGIVDVTARQEGEMICISVIDNGPGIPADKHEAVFEPFISGKATGMGLGLAICRTIVEAHGGRLWCEDAPGGGAAFHFTVPVAETGNG